MTRVGTFIVALAVAAAVFGPLVVPYDPAAQALALRLQGPTFGHPFGLDELGRDVFARIVYGARVSMLVGLMVVSVSAFIGTLLGATAGYFGGRIDDVISRAVDILLAFPGILLAIALVAVLGPSLLNVVLALCVIGWVGYARLVRGVTLRTRELDFVHAARALGATAPRIVVRHVVPAALPALAVQATLGMAGAILAEASLSFLGLGVQPPTPTWGSMISLNRAFINSAPWMVLFPGIAISVTVISFNVVGDFLRDKLDPRFRG